MFSPFIDLLLLILVANGTPVVACRLFRGRFSQPLDFGFTLGDQYRILGPSKTWRGLLSSIMVTTLCAMIMDYPPQTGFIIALCSLFGDTLSSFIKRRLGKPSSSMFLLLDQVPESLLPAWIMSRYFTLDLSDVFILVFIFIVSELVFSALLFQLGIRNKPY